MAAALAPRSNDDITTAPVGVGVVDPDGIVGSGSSGNDGNTNSAAVIPAVVPLLSTRKRFSEDRKATVVSALVTPVPTPTPSDGS